MFYEIWSIFYVSLFHYNCILNSVTMGATIAAGWAASFRFPAGAKDFLLSSIQTNSGAHPASGFLNVI
jgi:hypothetical protein